MMPGAHDFPSLIDFDTHHGRSLSRLAHLAHQARTSDAALAPMTRAARAGCAVEFGEDDVARPSIQSTRRTMMMAKAFSLFIGERCMDAKKQLEVSRLELRFCLRERVTRIDHSRQVWIHRVEHRSKRCGARSHDICGRFDERRRAAHLFFDFLALPRFEPEFLAAMEDFFDANESRRNRGRSFIRPIGKRWRVTTANHRFCRTPEKPKCNQ
jgi:hypothetical protein